jgi:hypothetical protein
MNFKIDFFKKIHLNAFVKNNITKFHKIQFVKNVKWGAFHVKIFLFVLNAMNLSIINCFLQSNVLALMEEFLI